MGVAHDAPRIHHADVRQIVSVTYFASVSVGWCYLFKARRVSSIPLRLVDGSRNRSGRAGVES